MQRGGFVKGWGAWCILWAMWLAIVVGVGLALLGVVFGLLGSLIGTRRYLRLV